MNYTRYITAVVLVMAAFACQPDEFPAIGERDAVVPRLAGTWKLTSVIQQDNDAERKGFPDFAQKQDITADFPFNQFTLVLNVNGNSPSAYTITTGDSPNIVGNVTSGNWTVDDVNYPSRLIFSGGEASIDFGSMAGLDDGTLVFRRVNTQPKAGKQEPVVSYLYTFTKQ